MRSISFLKIDGLGEGAAIEWSAERGQFAFCASIPQPLSANDRQRPTIHPLGLA